MRLRLKLLFLLACCTPVLGLSQAGGLSVYNFLRLTPPARITSLGGFATATMDGDVNLAAYNPALLGANLHQRLGMSAVNYISDIGFGQANYAHHLDDKRGTLGFSATYINYGKFDRTDPAGNNMGTFNANEVALQGGWGKELNRYFRTGVNVKYVGSFLESYRSHGVAIDMAGMYVDTANRITAALLIRNFGAVLNSYYPEGSSSALPLDIQLAFTNRLKYVPFRWGVVFHSLHNWNLRYNDPTDVYYRRQVLLNEGEQPASEGNPYLDEFFRHMVLNGELLLSKNFHVRFGYNHQRRRELLIPTRLGSSGFSWGFGLQVKRFRFDYGGGALTLAGSSHNFSVTTNLGDW